MRCNILIMNSRFHCYLYITYNKSTRSCLAESRTIYWYDIVLCSAENHSHSLATLIAKLWPIPYSRDRGSPTPFLWLRRLLLIVHPTLYSVLDSITAQASQSCENETITCRSFQNGPQGVGYKCHFPAKFSFSTLIFVSQIIPSPSGDILQESPCIENRGSNAPYMQWMLPVRMVFTWPWRR